MCQLQCQLLEQWGQCTGVDGKWGEAWDGEELTHSSAPPSPMSSPLLHPYLHCWLRGYQVEAFWFSLPHAFCQAQVQASPSASVCIKEAPGHHTNPLEGPAPHWGHQRVEPPFPFGRTKPCWKAAGPDGTLSRLG